MKKEVLLAIACFYVFFIQAQHPGSVFVPDTATVIRHEVLPEFPGGMSGMSRIIEDHMEYPKTALKEGIGGRVIVGFTIDTTGSVQDIHILKGIRDDLDQEAMRLVGLLRKWKPAMVNDKKVKVKFTLPLTFYPEKHARRKSGKEKAEKKSGE